MQTYQPPWETSLDMAPIFPGYFGGIPGYEVDEHLKRIHTHKKKAMTLTTM